MKMVKLPKSLQGMTHKQIMKQADEDTKKQKKKKDPISHAHKESSKSPKSMFKSSMKHLNKLLDKGK
jgi:hypothetical protein